MFIIAFTKLYTLLLALFISFSLLFIYKTLSIKKKKEKQLVLLPPGPKPWPLIGSFFQILRNKPSFRFIHKLMNDFKTEIMCLRLGSVYVIFVTSPELACEFLKSHDATFASRPLCMSAEIPSTNYLTTVVVPFGDRWKKMKKILTSEVLSPARHRWLQHKRDEESDNLVRYVYNQCMNSSMGCCGVVNLKVATQHYTGNVSRRILFGKRWFGKGKGDGGPGAEEEEHVWGIFTILKYLYAFSVSDYVPWLRRFDVDGHEKMMQKAVESVRKYHDPEIDDRIQMWEDGLRHEHEDILDVLITLKDSQGQKMLTTAEIKAQIIVSQSEKKKKFQT